ncbi:hypothetical protein [Paraburkholderia fungorum]|nr:hypothetical protein [Paraburkholderia fungorum]MBB4516326.1 hypothetical protein [Paraburkholderia fungorum]MBB5546762.1 hypothetical protein [Paraburkholderia fungorum]MBB6205201.1 hypothetical protein [Paraburkholderia fungorum]MBU7440798.1 hypothetical protein [Paraburkholderia fungorum]MDE1009236.1 hypothetical protein [Paraburkholderia fungorum]
MHNNETDEIAESLNADWEQRLPDNLYRLIAPVWAGRILPALKANADRNRCPPAEFGRGCALAMRLTEQLFEALHDNSYALHAADAEGPLFYWLHQRFNILRANDSKRGLSIDKEALLSVAAEYLSHPDIRCNYFDWLLLDAIVFAELDAFGYHVINTKAGTGTSVAAALADGKPVKYFLLLTLFRLTGFALGYVVPPVLSIWAISNGHMIVGWSIAGLWVLSVFWSLVTFPARWKARRKTRSLLTQLLDLYQILGDSTISPRLLKETLDRAIAAGVVLDGAVASIIDRMIARDATTFVPAQTS